LGRVLSSICDLQLIILYELAEHCIHLADVLDPMYLLLCIAVDERADYLRREESEEI
jgi:hypothetical protein